MKLSLSTHQQHAVCSWWIWRLKDGRGGSPTTDPAWLALPEVKLFYATWNSLETVQRDSMRGQITTLNIKRVRLEKERG
jgi:hypothetical protein